MSKRIEPLTARRRLPDTGMNVNFDACMLKIKKAQLRAAGFTRIHTVFTGPGTNDTLSFTFFYCYFTPK